jgi:hypothetical protein
MKTMTTAELGRIRYAIAQAQGLEEVWNDVRCYHCKKWGYNRGKAMNSMGESKCYRDKTTGKTASYQWCKCFEYVGNGK